MESKDAVAALAALAHDTRLALFRMLARAGDDGVSAGGIAATLSIAASTLSHHLSQLEHAGLITARRESRHIFYAIAVENVRALLGYLTDECCAGRPELCGVEPSRTDSSSC